jgi:hypothetical protein
VKDRIQEARILAGPRKPASNFPRILKCICAELRDHKNEIKNLKRKLKKKKKK